MDFYDNQPIYKQIVDYCHAQAIEGGWKPGERIPSTKELALALGVNTRTVMRAYDTLADDAIIYQRRGLGYYLSDDAPRLIMEIRRAEFLNNTVLAFAAEMKKLNLTPDDILPLLS